MTWIFGGRGGGMVLRATSTTLYFSQHASFMCMCSGIVKRLHMHYLYSSLQILGDFANYKFDFFHCKAFLFRVHGIEAYLNNTLQDF